MSVVKGPPVIFADGRADYRGYVHTLVPVLNDEHLRWEFVVWDRRGDTGVVWSDLYELSPGEDLWDIRLSSIQPVIIRMILVRAPRAFDAQPLEIRDALARIVMLADP